MSENRHEFLQNRLLAFGENATEAPTADRSPFPHRALWASHAPFSWIATLTVLLGCVCSTYAYVFYQIKCLRKGI